MRSRTGAAATRRPSSLTIAAASKGAGVSAAEAAAAASITAAKWAIRAIATLTKTLLDVRPSILGQLGMTETPGTSLFRRLLNLNNQPTPILFAPQL
jgi:hypothetical protein